MDRDKIQEFSDRMASIYLEIEQQILVNAGVALSKDKGLLDKDVEEWRISKLLQLAQLNQQNMKLLARYSNLAMDELKAMLKEIGYQGAETMDEQIALITPASVVPVAESSAITAILVAFEQQAVDKLNLVNTTMLDGSQQVYRDILDQTTAKVLTGVSTGPQALRETARKWANKGIPTITDVTGRKWSVEAYVPMITRTLSNQVSNQMQEARMDEHDIDLIEVSSHMGARPRCAPFQGRIYSRSGASDKYPPFSSTSYGEPAGLFGINCGHVMYPFVEGHSIQRHRPYGKAENDEAYQQSQQQRSLERQIRKAKKELNMMNAMKDKEGIAQAKSKIRQKQANLREFIEDTGRTRRRNREQIVT